MFPFCYVPNSLFFIINLFPFNFYTFIFIYFIKLLMFLFILLFYAFWYLILCTYHEVSQLQSSLAAVEERVVLPDDHALWLAELGCLHSELRRVAHFRFDLHVGWHGSTEHVQKTGSTGI